MDGAYDRRKDDSAMQGVLQVLRKSMKRLREAHAWECTVVLAEWVEREAKPFTTGIRTEAARFGDLPGSCV